MIKKAIIPVAGLGTRMLPITQSIPKEMLPLGRKPVLHRVVDELATAGVDQVLFITASHKNAIKDYFDRKPQNSNKVISSQQDPRAIIGDGSPLPSLEYSFIQQDTPSGNGDAVRLGRSFVGEEDFVVAWGDTVIQSSIDQNVMRRMIEVHLEEKSACTIAVQPVCSDKVSNYGIVRPLYESDWGFPIDKIVEKPSVKKAPSKFAVSARYICDSSIFPALEATSRGRMGELWLADAIQGLIRAGRSVWCVPLGIDSLRYDIGTPLTYWEAFTNYAIQDEYDGPAFSKFLKRLVAAREDTRSD